jgi:hypothetical protein
MDGGQDHRGVAVARVRATLLVATSCGLEAQYTCLPLIAMPVVGLSRRSMLRAVA